MAVEPRVYIRKVNGSDRKEITTLAQTSQKLHSPWISPPLTAQIFRLYMKRARREDSEGIACCLIDTDEIVGIINLNEIVRGSFLSANVSYYVSSDHYGKGYMTEALKLVVKFAFENIGLHRVEAAIQPDNQPSINLVKRCGFRYEGLAKDLLFINGKWRDHERWAVTDPRVELARVPQLVV